MITRDVLRFTVSLLCAVLIFNGMPLNAASSSEELRHEAFLRGGKAIEVALNANDKAPAVSKAIEEGIPSSPASFPAPAKPQAGKSSGLSKPVWVALITGFAFAGYVIYWSATGSGASVRNCSTCAK